MGKLGSGGGGGRSVIVPFPIHQVVDYLGGLYLLQVGSHLRGRPATVAYGAGAVILVAAALSGRPLGGGPISRPLHRIVDIALIVGVAAAPFVFGFSHNVPDLLRFDGFAAALAVVVRYTNYVRPRPRNHRETARAIKEQGPRVAGQLLGRRLAAKRRPPDPS